jgi:cytochrome c oxidase subunit 4
MSTNTDTPHIVPYRTFIYVLLGLLACTFTSIAVTSYNLGPYSVLAALLISTGKTLLILTFFMHLKWDVKLFAILVGAVLALIAVVIFITLLDYLTR